MKKVSLLLFALSALCKAEAQVSFTGEYTNDFNSYTSLGTLPSGWSTGGSGGFIGSGTGTGTGGGFYSFYPTCCSSDRALGALHSGSATGYYQANFTNSTGSTITSLNISYDFEQYRRAGNTTGWSVLFNGAANAALAAAGTTASFTTGVPYIESKSTTITGLSIAPGATFWLRWTVTDASGSDNPVAIDNFKMCVPGNAFDVTVSSTSPVTEPAPLTLSASATGGTSAYDYDWSGPLSFTSTAASPIINPTAVANSGTYTVLVTDAIGCTASATTSVTVNPGAACSGAPVSGTASATPSALCVSGSSTVTVTGATAASGLTYQWQSSATGTTGSFTAISGATDIIYTTPAVTSTTYYRLVTTCAGSGLSDTSSVATLTINPLPSLTTTPSAGIVCSGGSGLGLGVSGADTYIWAPATGLSASTGASVTANPAADVTYTVTGTNTTTGCSSTATATVGYSRTPDALSVTPSAVALCEAGAPQLLSKTGGMVGPTTISSGSVTIPSSISAFGTITTSVLMGGIPAGATITGASVNIISFGSQYQDDYIVNIKAPNGNMLNLIRQIGTHTSAVTILFNNTNLSSASSTAITTGSGAFTGTWAAQAFSGAGAAPYASNVTNWNSLFSVPNGTWTLSIYNNTSFSNVVTPTMQWSITLNYSYSAPVTWSPTTNLYTDAAATTPYTGAPADDVYVNPVSAASITYTAVASNNGCTVNATAAATVNPLPAAITGTLALCPASTATLTNTATGGAWSSGTPANATIDPATGVVTGILAGTTTITYTLPTGCFVTAEVTVNPLPAAIAGTMEVCAGATTTLTSATTGGTWHSGTPAHATVDASGLVTGVLAGTSAITYTSAEGCITTTEVTVNPLPAAISGPFTVCEGLTTTLSNTTTGGTWSSGNPANATVDASGVVTGVLAGTATITYTLPAGCIATSIVTINALPAAITGTLTLCEGLTTTLGNTTTGGTWTSGTPANATINASGIVTGVLAGTSIITYTSAESCIVTTNVTVNALPASITGTAEVCVGATTTLSNTTTGGTWSSSNANASIDAAGTVTGAVAGTATTTYMLPTGCIATSVVTVNPLPTISGTLSVCVGATSNLTASIAGGTWVSTTTAMATITSGGVVSGVAAGTSVISYTTPMGCLRTATVTVNALPAAIGGTPSVCVGATTALTNTGGGSWTSSNGLTTIGASSGIATGVAAGTSVITYTLATSCYTTATITVNALPSAITGTAIVCEGFTTTLSSPGGGTWASSNSNASVGTTTGIVTGNTAGTALITYTLSTGCFTTRAVTINALPSAISGTPVVCIGASAALTGPGGGTWSSSNSNVTITPASGIMTGVTAGASVISYTLSTGCFTTTVATINALPALFTTTGGGSFCAGGAGVNVELSGSAAGINYQLFTGGTATGGFLAGTGAALDFGLQTTAGTYSVLATDAATGCMAGMTGTVSVTITPLVTPGVTISNGFGDTVCSGIPVTFTATPVNGGATPAYAWEVNGTPVGTSADTYTYTPADGDMVSVTLTSAAGCASPATAADADTITVITSMMPSVTITASPGTSVCAGTAVTFSAAAVNGGASPAYLWTKNGINVATGPAYTVVSMDGDIVLCKLYSSLACRMADSVASGPLTMTTTEATAPPVVTISATPGATIAPGASVTLTATVTGAGASASYQWYLNGTVISGATTTSYTSSSFTNGDAVTFVATKNTACLEKGDQTIAIAISNAIGGASANAAISVFPNPNSGDFTVTGSCPGNSEAVIEMTNLVGQVVYHLPAQVTNGRIDAHISAPATLASGMYLLNVQTNSQHQVFHITITK